MKSTIHYKDLTKKDGFPSDIDRTKTVVVQVYKNLYALVLYTSKYNRQQQYEFNFEKLNLKEGLYIINS